MRVGGCAVGAGYTLQTPSFEQRGAPSQVIAEGGSASSTSSAHEGAPASGCPLEPPELDVPPLLDVLLEPPLDDDDVEDAPRSPPPEPHAATNPRPTAVR